MARFDSEADAADVVIGYLRDLKFDVYCEVDSKVGRIDIVALQGSVLTAIEVKNRCNLDVLGQAASRQPFVHRSIAAFPFPKHSRHPHTCFRSMHLVYGIGVWDIQKYCISEAFAPVINRKPMKRYVEDCLCDEQKNQRAGVNRGYWSPFQRTKERIVKHVTENQPCTLKSVIESVEHHYGSDSSAYTSVGKWIRQGVIGEVTMTRDGLVLSE